MEFRERVARVGLSGVLVALAACGGGPKASGERASGAPASAATTETAPGLESAGRVRARATIAGPPGSSIKGEVTFVELAENFPVPGVKVDATISGPSGELAPGNHGLHIHENAKGGCVPPFTAAGGHFDPGPVGNADPDVNHPYHMGDIPNLVVDRLGVGAMDATTSRITLSPGPLSIFDGNGSVVIVHQNPDSGVPGPVKSGVSGGPRIACGVIELVEKSR
ncbi:MAG TPA: superoxide dismutase family protein [Gemmatimonadales bacterium]|nr:superoxide dismutase family protein [Gemmatimonadales bacterium]